MMGVRELAKSDLTSLLTNAAGYRKSHILLTGINFDVFSVIEKLPRTDAKSIATALKINERGVDRLLGGLIALDLVSFDGTQYKNKQTARTYLVRSSPFYLGEGIRTLFDIGQDTWGALTKTIEKGTPLAVQRTDAVEADFWPKLTQAIRPFNIPVAESAAALLLYKKEKIRKVLDLGGGSGVFGNAFLKQYPKAKVIQVDWPQVNEEARKYNDQFVKEGRFITLNGDLFETPWEQEGPFDVVILSHIIHQEDIARIKTLIRRIGNTVDENTEVIINEFAVNESKNYPPYSLIFGLSMVLQNAGGGVYSFSEMDDMMSVIDHEIYMTCSPVPPSTLFFTRKKLDQSKASKRKGEAKKLNISTNNVEYFTSLRKIDHGGFKPTSFMNIQWDSISSELRETWLLSQFREQLFFAKKESKFWGKRIPESLFKTEKFTRDQIESLPVFLKSDFRILDPYDLTAKSFPNWYIVRGSGGTTGRPTNVMWTHSDWRAAIETSARFLNQIRDWKQMKIWNGYNQAHVAGPAFDDIIRMVGATPIPRHFKSTDQDALKEMELFKVQALVLTPKSGSGKGGSLEDFLAIDPNFISRLGIKYLWVSSTPLDKELVKELQSLGVESIVNFYGSTESMPNAISCPQDPKSFHLCQGHVFIEVLDDNGKHVKSGQRGTVVVSRIASSQGQFIGPAQGTQLFRYVVGDSAVYHSETCSCGRTSPRISQVERLPLDEDKIMGGCERWD